jgi:hypothetical protein
MNERDESLNELSRLLTRLCDGELDADGFRRVEELVRGNAEARQLYMNYLLLDGELRWAGGTPNVQAPVQLQPELAAAADSVGGEAVLASVANGAMGLQVGQIDSRQGFRARSRGLLLAVIALAAALLVMASRWFGPDDSEHPLAQQPVGLGTPALPAITADESQIAIAELRSNEGCRWGGEGAELVRGTQLYAGQELELVEGVARFAFAKGATVLVESPAKFQLSSATSLRLMHGNVAVRAQGPVKDFIVYSRDASIVDLGTSFAVHADEINATEVEVLEGTVVVVPENNPKKRRVLEMGASVQIDSAGNSVSPMARRPDDYRFTNLIEQLWGDVRVAPEASVSPDGKADDVVEANFTDRMPGAIDTFYAAKRGDGWLTPWVASGNPQGRILSDDASFGAGNPFLSVKFNGAYERAIAREYGARLGFDPNLPHVISWRWRLNGKSSRVEQHFFDRVTFYGNPFFRRSSWPTNSWLIGVVGGDEDPKSSSQPSTRFLKSMHGAAGLNDESLNGPRQVHAQRWYFFDNRSGGVSGAVFDRHNMVDTGMTIKANVLYHFAVAIYPQEAKYDAAIRDDEQTVVRTGLAFRSRETVPANVIHFTMHATKANDKRSFSLDSVHIEPLSNTSLREQLEDHARQDETTAPGIGE